MTDGSCASLLNPSIIIEVLSNSTEAAVRGRKFACYRTLASLNYYLLVSQAEYAVDLHSRQPDDTWNETFVRGLDGRLLIESMGIALPFSDLYDAVSIMAEPAMVVTGD